MSNILLLDPVEGASVLAPPSHTSRRFPLTKTRLRRTFEIGSRTPGAPSKTGVRPNGTTVFNTAPSCDKPVPLPAI
jgi:hypothetical protein